MGLFYAFSRLLAGGNLHPGVICPNCPLEHEYKLEKIPLRYNGGHWINNPAIAAGFCIVLALRAESLVTPSHYDPGKSPTGQARFDRWKQDKER